MTQRLEVRVSVSGMGKYASEMQRGAQANKRFGATGSDVNKVGGNLQRLGDSLTRNVTLPIVAVGAAATKMAADFDSTFTRMTTLAGVSSDAVDGLKQQVLGLAEETGRGPQELAEALEKLTSSGLDTDEAMKALDASAKASAVGLGDTATVADAVSSAMLAYADAGLEASDATDILIATARAGKAEPAELASQMGKLLPISSQLGIAFDDVGAAIAVLSQSGNDAAASSTQLAALMGKLLRPSQQASEALEAVGLSVEDVQASLREKGLLGTLEMLKARLGESGFVKFAEDQEAVRAALALTGGDMNKIRDIFGDLDNAAGATDEAFGRWAQSMGAKNAKAFAQFQVTMIEFGEIALPIVSNLISLAGDAVAVFGHLPEPVQTTVAAFLALLAAAGPLITMAHRLRDGWALAMKIFENWTSAGGRGFAAAINAGTEATNNMSTAQRRLHSAAGIATKALGALAVAMAAVEFITSRREARASSWVEDVVGDPDSLREVRASIADVKAELDELDDREGKGRLFSVGDIDVFATSGDADRDERIEQLRESLAELEAQEADLVDQEGQTASAYVGTDNALAGLNEETADAINQLAEYSDKLRAQFDPLFGMIDALRGNRDAQAEITAAQEALNEAVAKYGPNSAEARAATDALTDAQLNAAKSALDVESAAAQLVAGIEAGTVSVDEAKSHLQDWIARGLYPSGAAADAIALQFDAAAESARSIPGTVHTDVSTSGTVHSRVALTNVRDAAHSIPGHRNVNVTTSGTQYAVGQLDNVARAINAIAGHGNVHVSVGGGGGFILHEGGIVPGPRGQEIAGVLLGGEEVLAYDDPRHSANLGRYGSRWMSAEGGVGGVAAVVNNFDFRGAIITSRADAERWVTDAWNRGAARGLANVRGKRIG